MGKIEKQTRALLITGTVVPNSNYVAHTNVDDRLEEYYKALVFYADRFPDDDLYFLENSSYHFETNTAFTELFAKRNIRLMKFPVSDKFTQGKGYQEFEMLDRAVDQLSGKYVSFIKITGRYLVHNLKSLTDFNCKGLVMDHHKTLNVSLTNVFYVTGRFYQAHLKGLYKQVNDGEGIFIEKLVYDNLIRKNVIRETTIFRQNPKITGISGSYGGTLNRNKYKQMMRNVERIGMRILGIKQFLIEY